MFGSGIHETGMKGIQSWFADTTHLTYYSCIKKDIGHESCFIAVPLLIFWKSCIYGCLWPVLTLQLMNGHNAPFYFNWSSTCY